MISNDEEQKSCYHEETKKFSFILIHLMKQNKIKDEMKNI
uniref:Uncharacterized protein n=1 Tax=Tetranychus urticae TaxID=32264 RepID=T1KXG7_TETUR